MLKRRFRDRIGFYCGAGVMIAMITQPQLCVDAAQRAMRMWFEAVAPALFPFLALMPLITGDVACAAYNRMFRGAMRLLDLPGSAAPAVAIGMIAGSPGGAIAARRIAANAGLNMGSLRRLLPAITGVSPAFLIGMGNAYLGGARIGARLAIVQAAAQLIMLLLMRFCTEDDPRPVAALPNNDTGAVRGAVEAILVVCGYMVVFAVASNALIGGTPLIAFIDLPGGFSLIADWNIGLKPMLIGAAAGFAGICICAQNVRALAGCGVGWRDVLICRGVCACLCAIGARIVWSDADAPGFSPDAFALSMLCALICAVPALMVLTHLFILNRDGNRSE